MPTKKSKYFISPNEGDAWYPPSRTGNLVFTIHKEGICSLHVRQVDVNEIEESFMGLVATIAGPNSELPMQVRLNVDKRYSTKEGQVHTQIFGLSPPETIVELQMAISTNGASNASRQALLSIGITKRHGVD